VAKRIILLLLVVLAAETNKRRNVDGGAMAKNQRKIVADAAKARIVREPDEIPDHGSMGVAMAEAEARNANHDGLRVSDNNKRRHRRRRHRRRRLRLP